MTDTNRVYRTATFDRDVERAEGDERIPMALSSDEVLPNAFGGLEILDHTADGVDLTYASRGLPLMRGTHVAHGGVDQVGIVEDVHIGADRKLRGFARFSRSAAGQEARQDVEDGIRNNVSIGGIRLALMGRERIGKNTVERFKWQPVEVTLVPVPMDVTVGVGRSAESPVEMALTAPPAGRDTQTASPAKGQAMSDNAAASGAASSTTSATPAVVEIKQYDAAEVLRMAQENGMAEKALGWIERKLDGSQVALEILRDKRKAEAVAPVAPVERAADIRSAEPSKFKTLGEQLGAIVRASLPGGNTDPRLINRAVSGSQEGVASDGGFLVQQEFVTELTSNAFNQGAVLSRVRRIPIGADKNGVVINMVDETSRVAGSQFGGIQTYWVGEGDTATAKKPKFRRAELTLRKLMGIHYATDELLADATALGSVSAQGFGEAITFMLEDAVINGLGGSQPLGILTGGSVVEVAKESAQTAATVNTANLAKMYSRMHPRSLPNAVWLVNPDVMPQLIQLTLLAGTSSPGIFLPGGNIAGAPFGTLLGRPIIPVEYCATLGTVGDILLVDLGQYLTIDKGGLDAQSSMHVRFLYDEMTFRYVYRFDGQPAWKSALTPAKGSNTLSPYVSLATRA